MTDTFYVIYNPATDTYQNACCGFGSYVDAEQFISHSDAEWEMNCTRTGLKIVGPCIEGDPP